MKLILPYPPSANRLWRSYSGRTVLSEESILFKHAVKHAVWEATQPEGFQALMQGWIVLHVDIYRPQKTGDLDNRLKAICDALTGVVYKDDKQVIEIHARRFDDKANPRAEVTVEVQEGGD